MDNSLVVVCFRAIPINEGIKQDGTFFTNIQLKTTSFDKVEITDKVIAYIANFNEDPIAQTTHLFLPMINFKAQKNISAVFCQQINKYFEYLNYNRNIAMNK